MEDFFPVVKKKMKQKKRNTIFGERQSLISKESVIPAEAGIE